MISVVRSGDASSPCITLEVSSDWGSDQPVVLSEIIGSEFDNVNGLQLVVIIHARARVFIVDSMSDRLPRQLRIELRNHAQLKFVARWSSVSSKSFSSNLTCTIDRGALFEGMMFCSEEGTSVVEINLVLQGRHAQARLHVAQTCFEHADATVNIEQRHIAPSTNSFVVMRALVGNHASSIHKGMIALREQAAGSSVQQEYKALLLSQDAQAKTLPQLEVLTHEVRCKHGSAVGMLDQEQLWYLQARGIPIQHARKVLTHNFIAQIVPSWVPREFYEH